MTVQWSAAVRNAVVDAWESAIGASPHVELRTGDHSGVIATPAGTLLASVPLAVDWASPASGGIKAMAGLPAMADAVAPGLIGHYRIIDSVGACHEQGSVTVTGGGGDLTVDNPTVTLHQTVLITSWSKTAPSA